MQKRLVLKLFLSSSLSYFFLIFSALSGLVAVSVAPLFLVILFWQRAKQANLEIL
jgi:Na+/proline symporter